MMINTRYKEQLSLFSGAIYELNGVNIHTLYSDSNMYKNILDLVKTAEEIFKYTKKGNTEIINNIKAYIVSLPDDINLEIILAINDVINENRIIYMKRAFEHFKIDQPIFKLHPEIFEKISVSGKQEYLHSSIIEYQGLGIDNDNVKFLGFKYKNTFFKAPIFPDTNIAKFYDYIFEYYKSVEIKISPYYAQDHKNVGMLIQHGTIKPIDPTCIRKFNLPKGYSGGCYDLSYLNQEYSESNFYKKDQEISKKILKIDRLEVIITNRNNDMSMMLEEIKIDSSNNQVIGRCIHLDVLDAYNKNLTELNLNHIDFAINVYQGENGDTRLSQNLSEGKKTIKADYRTHLLRLEEIPFIDFVKLAHLFLESKSLVFDWIDDQFENKCIIDEFF